MLQVEGAAGARVRRLALASDGGQAEWVRQAPATSSSVPAVSAASRVGAVRLVQATVEFVAN